MTKATRLLSGAGSVGVVGGLAGATALLLGPGAQAVPAIQWFATGTHTAVGTSDTGTFGRVEFDLDGDGNHSFGVWAHPVAGYRLFFAGAISGTGLAVAITNTGSWGDGYAARFTDPLAISAHTHWKATNTIETVWRTQVGSIGWSEWSQGQGLLGVRIDNGPGYDYYWIEITPGATAPAPASDTMAFINWSGAASASGGGANGGGPGGASGTPEPAASGLALLALGAAGVMRKRRNQPVA
jgi:hypothetical protein